MTTTAPPLELQALERLREEELEEARAIQSMMMPTESLRTGGVMILHGFQPIAAVGGDFLDYFELTDRRIGLYLGDVSGKGLPAALYAALAVGTLRGVHKTGTAPHDVLATLNRRLMIRGMPRRHTAIQYAVFDPESHELRIGSAGMPGPLHLASNGCRVLEINGIPPGLFPATAYETLSLRLEPGDSVLFCTDGITDAFDCEGEQFGIERLQEICEADRPTTPADIAGAKSSRLLKNFPRDGNSMTTWQRPCFIFAAEDATPKPWIEALWLTEVSLSEARQNFRRALFPCLCNGLSL